MIYTVSSCLQNVKPSRHISNRQGQLGLLSLQSK